MRILLIEDDRRITEFLLKGLREAGYAVDHSADGEEGLARALAEAYDAAIIDLMLPRRDGLSVIDALRARGSSLPVLILSAKRSLDERVAGLQRGGDDYLVKPFAFAELLARIQALIRRGGQRGETSSLVVGPLAMNLLTRDVRRGDVPIVVQPREYALLEYLMRNAGRVVSKTMILQHVWSVDFDPQTSAVDVLVHRLRQKIDHTFEPKLIETVRGVGYVLRAP
jgi:two-component system OmpR family response regulator